MHVRSGCWKAVLALRRWRDKPPRMALWREFRDGALALVALAAMIALAWAVDRWGIGAERIAAQGSSVHVVDGDSLRIGDREIRLSGIDAPELRQACRESDGTSWPCGREAGAALEAFANEPGFACDVRDRDRYGRALARCHSEETGDVGEALVREGWAVRLSIGGGADYAFAEALAQRNRRGIWRGSFERPSDWRNR